ncbi:MAG: hypothetical protein ACYTKD_29990 [Planctomycetota bacterium]|jgi:hypothetical protein
MVLNMLRDSLATWSHLLVLPFMSFSLIWRMIPVYLNGFLASVYFPPSSPAAVFGGLTALWAGADWIRGYVVGGQSAGMPNWAVAIVFCAYGAFAMIAGLLKIKKLYPVCGRRSILTFFAVSLYPVQAGRAAYNKELLIAILVVAVPAIVLLELFAVHMRKNVLKVEH